MAIYRPSNGIWIIRYTASGSWTGVAWGQPGDVPVPGDYDGDGVTDVAVYRPSTGFWYLRWSVNGTFGGGTWGVNGDLPVPGDYDGDGRTDVAVYRPSTGAWYLWLQELDRVMERSGESPGTNQVIERLRRGRQDRHRRLSPINRHLVRAVHFRRLWRRPMGSARRHTAPAPLKSPRHAA